MKKVIAMLASVLTVASVLVGVQLAGTSAPQDAASALSGSQFDAGNIISDAEFYNGGGMSESAIQSFLNAQIGTCSSSSCLNVGRYSLNSHGADAMCSAVTGGSSLSAAQIIARVGAACGINPKVIIVTLQKEQALVNGGTARNPSAGILARAMGYACPDSANGGCDPAYSGVGNQVYWASWQWKRYGNPAGTSNYFTWFAPDGNRSVQYNPSASCGTKTVYIQNKATAALYYYTPYTPNQAALNNLYGTGDSCSAYGNRNFWRLYSDWFGSTSGGGTTAAGNLDGVTAGYNSVTVNGWALDTTTSASTRVDVYVGSAGTAVPAKQSRPDVGAAYPKLGSAHGFNQRITAAPGPQQVCVFAISANGATSANLGCSSVVVQDGSPFGSLDTASAVPGGVSVSGWAIDPETAASLDVHVYADGKLLQRLVANQNRADVGRAYPSAGPAHGYSGVVAAPPGVHSICVYGINVQNGGNRVVGSCTSVNVPGSKPIGSLDEVTTTPTSLTVRGWALDGDSASSIPVDVYVDGVGRRTTANAQRGDIARNWTAYGSAHGFSLTVQASNGPHQVCVYAINVGAGSDNTQLGCRTVTVKNAAPIGSLDVVTAANGSVQAAGWAIDPDTAAPIAVDVYVDGAGRRLTANAVRKDVARSYPSAGPNHGWSGTLAAASGQRQVCAYAIDSAGGANTLLGCRSVVVP
ncbi:hypothetical protein GCM10009706_00580 [Curtobacterium citreum]|uniref:Hemagglutinin n=1 Tax=Curtobacterium citreum TaxID=2036 RepID=A0ABT2HH92_9MICO|nr:hypothetical protein [Curtobacterium citreum]MCS6522642.1 hypothetical protein [Curtobacterium citreum]TQJ28550.1 hypothetical protein FB462_2443 [Curtobacterium citreum]GGL66009.1 hypothetical protein GCM10009706_00580 [Curtobacterium citreum]